MQRDFWWFFDWGGLGLMFMVSMGGVVLIYSALHTSPQTLWTRQLVWLVAAVICFLVTARMKTEFFQRWALIAFLALMLFLFLLLVLGRISAGTKSWLLAGGSVQISEVVKIPLCLLMARYLGKIGVIGWRELFRLLGLVGLPFVLIAAQPDFGTAFMLCSALLVAVLLKGIRPGVLGVTALGVALMLVLGWFFLLKPYQKDRVLSFVNPEKYSRSTGYQVIQSRIAIGSGGMVGKGFLKGSQSQFRFLPTRHTDFILSVLGEEFGFMGVFILFFMIFLLFFRQFGIHAQTYEELYFVYLFSGVVLFQFLINAMMTIGLMPIMGVPLPFVSYGGSSLMVFWMGQGMVHRIRLNNFMNEG